MATAETTNEVKATAGKKPTVTAEKNRKGDRAYSSDIISPVGRVSFPHLVEADSKAKNKFGDDKFKVTLLFPKDADLSELKAAVMAAAKAMWGEGVKAKDLKLPFQDGDKKTNKDGEVLDGYAGQIAVIFKSSKQPSIIDRARAALAADKVYGGCYARVAINAFTYETTENVKQPDGSIVKETIRGVAFGLSAVQFVKDGKPFGGGDKAALFDEIKDSTDLIVGSDLNDDDDII